MSDENEIQIPQQHKRRKRCWRKFRRRRYRIWRCYRPPLRKTTSAEGRDFEKNNDLRLSEKKMKMKMRVENERDQAKALYIYIYSIFFFFILALYIYSNK